MNRLQYFILAAFILASCRAYASDAPKELTLNECITIALTNNPSILQSGEDMDKSLAEYRAARAQRLPFVSFDVKSQQYPKTVDTTAFFYPFPQNILISQIQADQAKSDNPLSEYYNLGISFGITAGISLYNEKKSRMQKTAKTGITMTKLGMRKTIADTIMSVKQAYYSYTMASEYVSMRVELLKSNEDRLKITQILYKNAQRPILDLSKAQYEFGDSQLELEKARNKERAARVELFRVMGVNDPGDDVVLREYDLPGELRYSQEELYSHADLHYPDLQIVRIQKRINKLKVDVEMAGHYPEVELQAGMAYENGSLNFGSFGDNFKNNAWKSSFGVGFVARLPLYSGGLVSARVDSAKSDYKKSIYKEMEVLQAMRTAILNYCTMLEELRRQLDISKLMEENAKKHMLLARKIYESGAGTQLDLHDANVSLINARMGYLKAKNDYLITIAKLSGIVGLGEDSLCKK